MHDGTRFSLMAAWKSGRPATPYGFTDGPQLRHQIRNIAVQYSTVTISGATFYESRLELL